MKASIKEVLFAWSSGLPQQCLYLRPLPHGQGELRGIFIYSITCVTRSGLNDLGFSRARHNDLGFSRARHPRSGDALRLS